MAKTKIGVLSNMVNKPVKVFTTFASVDQIEQANGKLPSTSFIVASEVDANNEDTGVFNTFVTDADGYAAQISYINKVCYTSYSTNALYVSKVNNVNSLEARTMSSTQYGVARLAGDGALSNTNNGLGIALAPGQSLIIENNKLGLNNSYINNLIDKKVAETNNYKTVYTAYCDISDPRVDYLPHQYPNTYDHINVYYGSNTYGQEGISEDNVCDWIYIHDTNTYYISYSTTVNPSYTYDILQMVHKRSDGAIIPTLCIENDKIINNTSAESASYAFTYKYAQYPIYAFKFINSNTYSYTYYDNNGKLIYNDPDIWTNNLMSNLLTFDKTNNYIIATKEDNTISYEYCYTSELNNKLLLPENSTLSKLISYSDNFILTNYYNRSEVSINTKKLPVASSVTKGIASVKVGNGLAINNGIISMNTASSIGAGAVKIDTNNTGLTISSAGQLSLSHANDTAYGSVKIDNDTIKINDDGQINVNIDKVSTVISEEMAGIDFTELAKMYNTIKRKQKILNISLYKNSTTDNSKNIKINSITDSNKTTVSSNIYNKLKLYDIKFSIKDNEATILSNNTSLFEIGNNNDLSLLPGEINIASNIPIEYYTFDNYTYTRLEATTYGIWAGFSYAYTCLHKDDPTGDNDYGYTNAAYESTNNNIIIRNTSLVTINALLTSIACTRNNITGQALNHNSYAYYLSYEALYLPIFTINTSRSDTNNDKALCIKLDMNKYFESINSNISPENTLSANGKFNLISCTLTKENNIITDISEYIDLGIDPLSTISKNIFLSPYCPDSITLNVGVSHYQ